MKRLAYLFLCFFALAACREYLIEEPDGLISEQKMIEVYYDLALLKGMIATNGSVMDEHQIQVMPYLYNKYEIDSTTFVQSDTYYASQPVLYQKMYEVVKLRLDEQIEDIEEKRKQKQDSLKEVTKIEPPQPINKNVPKK